MKVNVHNLSTEEIQSKKTVNARTWRKCMSQHREVPALLSHCHYSSDSDTRSVFNPTACCNLHTAEANDGSYPIVVSGATLIIVPVAPVSRARRKTMLPEGPNSSA